VWDTVIGLEVHVQLLTESKLFSATSTRFGAPPNTQAGLVDLGFPGTLPVPNRAAVRMAVAFGLAVGGEIAPRSRFARKSYFYPDLPKGYQISQYDEPIVRGGVITIDLGDKRKDIPLVRAHLEEDAGKSLHDLVPGRTALDLNRAGVPLLEIVSTPVLASPEEAVAYLKALHTLVCYLGICDGNMQEGSLRADANVSLRPSPDAPLGTRTEIKNLNSFRFLEQALHYEIRRQAAVLEAGGTVVQETRLYDPDRRETRPMRTKEEAEDYRYFPDPDLLPVVVDAALIEEARSGLPELPRARAERFVAHYGLEPYAAGVLTASRPLADYYEAVVAALGEEGTRLGRTAAHWVMGDLLGALNRAGTDVGDCPVSPARLAALVLRASDGTLSGPKAKEIFEALWSGGDDVDALIEKTGARQIRDRDALRALVDRVLEAHPRQREEYLAGKDKLLGFFVGQAMKESGGRANPQELGELFRERLGR
jgi:aspartyl-tRNA(Asn)/glutamyl-tRNA(Gln) amidotransferase subunit B